MFVELVAAGVVGTCAFLFWWERVEKTSPNRALGGLLRRPERDSRVLRDGAKLRLTGRLVVSGTPAQRFDSKEEVAAVTLGPPAEGKISHGVTANARAKRLQLQVGDDLVELMDRVEVVIGSQEAAVANLGGLPSDVLARLERVPREELGNLVCRSVRAGDVVRVWGTVRLEAAIDNAGSYRQSAQQWNLYSAALWCHVDRGHPACVIPMICETPFAAGVAVALPFRARRGSASPPLDARASGESPRDRG